jgi:hypothetical protein
MKTRFLLPHYLKKIGWLLFVPSLFIGLYLWTTDADFDTIWTTEVFAIWSDPLFGKGQFFTITETGILDEILTLAIIVGGFFIGFSAHKDEDEFIGTLRTESLLWATYINAIIFLLATIFIYDLPYFSVLVFNAFTMILFFVVRFQFLLYRAKKTLEND